MTETFNPDDILRERLGPPVVELAERIFRRAEKGELESVVIVTQDTGEHLALYSGGCTPLETVGLLAWAQGLAAFALAEEEDDEDEDDEAGTGRK